MKRARPSQSSKVTEFTADNETHKKTDEILIPAAQTQQFHEAKGMLQES